jgi:hypothetical protein
VKRYDKCTRQRAGEVEEDVGSAVVGHVTLLNDTLLFEILVSELVRS